jgi:hypothetical protein
VQIHLHCCTAADPGHPRALIDPGRASITDILIRMKVKDVVNLARSRNMYVTPAAIHAAIRDGRIRAHYQTPSPANGGGHCHYIVDEGDAEHYLAKLAARRARHVGAAEPENGEAAVTSGGF